MKHRFEPQRQGCQRDTLKRELQRGGLSSYRWLLVWRCAASGDHSRSGGGEAKSGNFLRRATGENGEISCEKAHKAQKRDLIFLPRNERKHRLEPQRHSCQRDTLKRELQRGRAFELSLASGLAMRCEWGPLAVRGGRKAETPCGGPLEKTEKLAAKRRIRHKNET